MVPNPYKLTVELGSGPNGTLALQASSVDTKGAEKEFLRLIHGAKPKDQKALAELSGKDKTWVSKICTSLEKKGLITRAHGLHVTDAGLVALGVPVQLAADF